MFRCAALPFTCFSLAKKGPTLQLSRADCAAWKFYVLTCVGGKADLLELLQELMVRQL